MAAADFAALCVSDCAAVRIIVSPKKTWLDHFCDLKRGATAECSLICPLPPHFHHMRPGVPSEKDIREHDPGEMKRFFPVMPALMRCLGLFAPAVAFALAPCGKDAVENFFVGYREFLIAAFHDNAGYFQRLFIIQMFYAGFGHPCKTGNKLRRPA